MADHGVSFLSSARTAGRSHHALPVPDPRFLFTAKVSKNTAPIGFGGTLSETRDFISIRH
jgi:hypothetical protein